MAEGKKLLVVDDDPDVLEILRLSLDGFDGWSVCTVTGGADVARQLDTHTHDAVLLDIWMSDMDERAVLSDIRARQTDVPVIVLTEDPDPALPGLLRAQGASAVLHKPFDPLSIGADIASVLGWWT
jgi:CheY-like chemotaxis protein